MRKPNLAPDVLRVNTVVIFCEIMSDCARCPKYFNHYTIGYFVLLIVIVGGLFQLTAAFVS